jgi:hypothetical protein
MIAMLKDITPEQRLLEVNSHFLKVEGVAGLVSMYSALLLYGIRHDDLPNFWVFPFVAVLSMGCGSIVRIIWLRLTLWLANIKFYDGVAALGQPDANPRFVERFLENWWKNETLLDVFSVVFRVVLCVVIYRLAGPSVGLL